VGIIGGNALRVFYGLLETILLYAEMAREAITTHINRLVEDVSVFVSLLFPTFTEEV